MVKPDPEHAELIAAQEHLVRAALEGARAAVAPGRHRPRALRRDAASASRPPGCAHSAPAPAMTRRRAFSSRWAMASAWRSTEEPVLGLAGGDPLVAGDVLAIQPGLLGLVHRRSALRGPPARHRRRVLDADALPLRALAVGRPRTTPAGRIRPGGRPGVRPHVHRSPGGPHVQAFRLRAARVHARRRARRRRHHRGWSVRLVRSRAYGWLSGLNEIGEDGERGAGDRNGRGSASAIIDGGRICYALTVRNIQDPVAAHIHRGGRRVNGPIVVEFEAPSAGDPARPQAAPGSAASLRGASCATPRTTTSTSTPRTSRRRGSRAGEDRPLLAHRGNRPGGNRRSADR